MTARLNPKLTKRHLATHLPSGEENTNGNTSSSKASSSIGSRSTTTTSQTTETDSQQSGTTDDDSGSTSQADQAPTKNPKLHLLHNGKWIPKQVSSCIILNSLYFFLLRNQSCFFVV